MHLADLVFRELGADVFIALFEVLDVHLLAFLYERIDDVHLTSLFYLTADGGIEACPSVVKLMDGANGFASGRQLVDNGHIQVAIERHGKRTRNGGCRHHKHMRRTGVLSP